MLLRSGFALLWLVPCLRAAVCPVDDMNARGNIEEVRFFAVPLDRAHEAVADAMQAIGVLLYEDNIRKVRGERRPSRTEALRLPRGDEAVFSLLEPSEREGVQGTLIRVETRRSGGKNGEPKQHWSATVQEEVACLLSMLSVRAPASNPPTVANGVSGSELLLPAGTPVPLLLRRFHFSDDLRPNQRIVLEAARDIKVGGEVLLARGSLAIARIVSAQNEESGQWGKGAAAKMSIEWVAAVNGEKVPLIGQNQFQGGRKVRATRLLWDPMGDGWVSGSSFGLRAGTAFDAVVAKDQVLRLPGASAQQNQ